MSDHEEADQGPGLVSIRTLNIVVALLLIGASIVVITDSRRLGISWIEGQGPAPGYYPFYVGLVLGIASFVTLIRAVLRSEGGSARAFVTGLGLRRVVAVLLPSLVYVAAIGGISLGPVEVPGLGIYVSSAIFIAIFMIAFGRQPIIKSTAVGCCVALTLFFMFERWFLVALPKGPLEAALGYG